MKDRILSINGGIILGRPYSRLTGNISGLRMSLETSKPCVIPCLIKGLLVGPDKFTN